MVAQDEAIFMHYTVNPILINPAAAGFNESYNLQLNARAQWSGFKDSPKTYAAYYNGPIGKTFGLGLGVLSESAAQLTRLKVQMDVAFRFQFMDRDREVAKISAGFFSEFQEMTVDNEVVGSNFFMAGDNLLEDFLNGQAVFDAAIGFYGTLYENTFFGLTFNNLVSSRLDDIAGTTGRESFFQFYSFNLGHKFDIPEKNLNIEPSILIRQIRNSPFQVDFNLKAGFLDDQLIAGLSYRSLGALGILLGTKLNAFKLYYSYDVSFQRFQQFNMGSHEVTLAFKFEKKEKEINKGYKN
ncbi:MAG: hypothetical protein DHS20C18_43680 [Saprospiraceae bacterium]|nr:MAG: hypothetical protein DHS20C18_43680 [Saprospiraceae bacterium]